MMLRMEDEGGFGKACFEAWHAERFPGATVPPFETQNTYVQGAWVAAARAVYKRAEAMLVEAATVAVRKTTGLTQP